MGQSEPVGVETAARLLGVSEETVRKCVDIGLLSALTEKPRLLLDPGRLHEVAGLAEDLRAAGEREPELLDHVWYRLNDEAWLDDTDLLEGLAQMARGEYRTVHNGTLM
jgi:hypothetical protein